MIEIKCSYSELVDPKVLKANPRNPNRHSVEQAQRLIELFKFHGVRHPIIVSKQSGYIVVGHGRHMAALLAEMPGFPVVYQDFDSEDSEYSFLVSDNAIASWADLDLSAINLEIPNLHLPSLDLLGIKDFQIDPPPMVDQDKPPKTCPSCGVELS